MANKYVELRDDIGNSVPRICRWRTTWKCKKSPSYSGVVEALGDSKVRILFIIAIYFSFYLFYIYTC